MEPQVVSKVFTIKGMSCASCEIKIENGLSRIEGVKEVKASLAESTVMVSFDSAALGPEELATAIQKLGYEVVSGNTSKDTGEKKLSINQLLGIGIIIFALYLIIKSTVGFNFIPQVDQSVGYGMLFVIGLLTSLHCIAMCGGINLSQCVINPGTETETGSKFSKLKPSLLYNSGRVISYTLIGGLAGVLGSVVGFSGIAKGIVAIIGGLFMVVIGINMLEIFPWLRRIKISAPRFIGNKIYNNRSQRGPFYIGLLNGLMPCGPLQTMQLYALGTGSFLTGALSMFLFSLGTVPLMFGFGAVSSFLSNKFTRRMLKVSAILVIVLGLTMLSRGLSLSGVSIANPATATGNVAQIQGNVQVVSSTIESGRYYPILVQKGIPVRWTIKAKAGDLNGCNNPVTIPKYNLKKRMVPGDNIIEFTPKEEGTITYTCWMGMITSYIKVVPDLSRVSQADLDQINKNGPNQPSPVPASGSNGGCCSTGAGATRFANGKVPTDDLQIAKIKNGIQEVTIKVNDAGYSPAVVVLQRSVKAKIKFNPEKLTSCNKIVVFPEYRGQMDLSQGQLETPEINITQDFTFQCWMGMLHGYVKVVNDINKVDLDQIKKEIEAYRPASSGGGCCGR
jgi:uncharacterized protein